MKYYRHINPEDFENYKIRKQNSEGKPFRSPHASICGKCIVMDCSWMHHGEPVDGWEAEPSKLYDDGWKVLKCPMFKKGGNK